jgi:cytidylate kinase
MNRIITIAREFGSGGRELGVLLAEKLGYAYYDKEIISEIAKRTELSEEYVSAIVENRTHKMFPITIGRSIAMISNSTLLQQDISIYREQSRIIREMAEKSDCVIVGRCADFLLKDQNAFRIFVYSDMQSRIKRCREKGYEGSDLSDKEIQKKISEIDKSRADYYKNYTDQEWGKKENYDLMVNTTDCSMEELAEKLKAYITSE